MKRIKSYRLILLLVIVLLTGCGNKLKCEIKTNNYTSSVVIGYEEDKPTTYRFKDKMLFSVDSADAEIYYYTKNSEYSTLIEEKHASMRNTPEYVSLKIKYDFTKNKSSQENKLLISRDDTKESATSKLKSLGYTCK